MNGAKKNPFINEDSTVQKVMELADARFKAGEYSVAATLYKSMLLVDENNFYAEFKNAAATAMCEGKEYDAEVIFAWSDALSEARDRYYEYAGETKEFIDVIGREIELFEEVVLHRAEKALDARIPLARKLNSDCNLWKLVGKEWKRDRKISELIETAAAQQSTLGSFAVMLLSAWVSQLLGFVGVIREPASLDIAFYETLKKRAIEQGGRYYTEPSLFLDESIGDAFSTAEEEFSLVKSVVDDNLKKLVDILDNNIAACKEALYAKYWSEHPEERKALEDKKAALERQIADERAAYETSCAELEKEIESKLSYIDAANEKCASENESAAEQIDKLKEEKKEAGFFNFKARKEIRHKIKEIRKNDKNNLAMTERVVESLYAEKLSLEEERELLDSAFELKASSLEAKLKEIDEELTKERV